MTFEPSDCVFVCVDVSSVSMCVSVSAPLLAVQRLQPAGPCGTHLTGEQRRLSAYTAHESGEGRELRASLALENRQAGRETGGRRRRRKQTESQSS